MTPLQIALLAAIQGVTEFLPISSSAHLILVPWFLGIDESDVDRLAFDISLHFGTLLALLFVYGKMLLHVLTTGVKVRNLEQNLLLKLSVATLPCVLSALFLGDLIEEHLRAPEVTIYSLVGVSLFMLVAERRKKERRALSYRVAFMLGLAQALSLIPGTSRSGITISTALFSGLERHLAVRFSFLMAIPVVLGASLLGLQRVYLEGLSPKPYLVGIAASFLFGTMSLKFLIAYLARHRLDVFAYYRIGLAGIVLLFLFTSG